MCPPPRPDPIKAQKKFKTASNERVIGGNKIVKLFAPFSPFFPEYHPHLGAKSLIRRVRQKDRRRITKPDEGCVSTLALYIYLDLYIYICVCVSIYIYIHIQSETIESEMKRKREGSRLRHGKRDRTESTKVGVRQRVREG